MAVEIKLEEKAGHEVVVARASDKLTTEDYAHFIPTIERLIKEQGKIRMLFVMHDFHGWKAGALWEDIKFDFKHFADIERLAMVGEKNWEKWMASFCRPFTQAEIRYFDQGHADEAKRWIASD